VTNPWAHRVLFALACILTPLAAAAQDYPNGELPDVSGGMPDLKALAGARAAQQAGSRMGPDVVQAGAVDPNTYVLGPGDQLELNLWGRIDRTITLDVSPEGKVFLQGRGAVDLGGKTLGWARDRVLKAVADQYVGVHAELRLVRLRTFKVYLSGAVKSPGAVEATSATRASEPISAVGLEYNASRRNIIVRHSDSTTTRVDLDAFNRLGRLDLNPMLIDGDVIQVPAEREHAQIAGAVPTSMEAEIAPGDDIKTLVALAGGLTTSATPEQAFMVRFQSGTERESLSVDLTDPKVLAMPLHDGDRLFIPYQPEYHYLPTVEIRGEVEHPGFFPITMGRHRLSDLVGWSGGFRPTANRAAVHLIRGGPAAAPGTAKEVDPEFDRLVRLSRNEMTESEYTKLETKLAEQKNTFTIDWSRLQPGSSTDPLLQEGDVVRVDRFVPTVRIEGQVKRPGYVDYAPGRTLSEYIELAGGFTERSARSSVRVSRSMTGQIIPARSIKSVLPGDFIWVPERRDIEAWTAFRDIVTVVGQVAVIIFTLSQ